MYLCSFSYRQWWSSLVLSFSMRTLVFPIKDHQPEGSSNSRIFSTPKTRRVVIVLRHLCPTFPHVARLSMRLPAVLRALSRHSDSPYPFGSEIPNQSENCLSLRIARPAHYNSTKSLPVMFYLFGGTLLSILRSVFDCCALTIFDHYRRLYIRFHLRSGLQSYRLSDGVCCKRPPCYLRFSKLSRWQ